MSVVEALEALFIVFRVVFGKAKGLLSIIPCIHSYKLRQQRASGYGAVLYTRSGLASFFIHPFSGREGQGFYAW